MSALTIAARFAVLALLSGLAACSILPKAEPLQVYLLPSQDSAPSHATAVTWSVAVTCSAAVTGQACTSGNSTVRGIVGGASAAWAGVSATGPSTGAAPASTTSSPGMIIVGSRWPSRSWLNETSASV